MTMTMACTTAEDRSFLRVAAITAIVSLPLAAGNILTMFLAVHFNLNAISHPLELIREGATGAQLWHWAMVLDILGYYLLIVPVIMALRGSLRPKSPNWVDLASLCLLMYCFIGAIGGAILATALPPLVNSYSTAGSQRIVLESIFNSYSNGVYRGMWNLLEEFLAAIGWIGFGLVSWSRHRRLGQTTTLLGLACLVDSVGTALNIDAIGSVGLTVYLILAPIWACWAGILLLQAKAPFVTAGNIRTGS
jgi:hypothetical protein